VNDERNPLRATLLRQRAEHLEAAARIDRELADLETGAPAFYSTETERLYPPKKKTRRAARDAIRQVQGFECIGVGRATIWRCGVTDYHRHFARNPKIVVLGNSTDEEIATKAIERAGLRSTRGER
jgi:hypothetical protein